MLKKILTGGLFILTTATCLAQNTGALQQQAFADSTVISVHASYDKGNKIHRWLFGENFRKEWAAKVKLPLIDINKIQGGLNPLRYGGGMETKAIRMEDKNGREWVIRSVEKTPDKLLPEELRQTFALTWVDDEYSGQHPYSALVVPPLAEAVNVPHAHPVIGVLVANPKLGAFGQAFAGRVVLLEEREPTGKSENTINMLKGLIANNYNRIDGDEFLRARMLDLLVGDWDRHEDQWRWTSEKKGKEKIYTAVPRDRDQVFHVDEGFFPKMAATPWLDPVLGNFNDSISHVKYGLFKTRFIQQFPDAQFSYAHWMKVVNDFTKAETDAVLELSLQCLPKEIYQMKHDRLLAGLKKRRDRMPKAMSDYYYFINRIVDLRTSDQDEQVNIEDAPDSGTRILITRLNKNGKEKDDILDMIYQPSITKEIRLYVAAGNDHVVINCKNSRIKLRIVGSNGAKSYDVQQASKIVDIYGRKDSVRVTGKERKIRVHLANDTTNTRFLVTNPYNIWMPLTTGEINRDDGFLLGVGFRYTGKDGFRKLPYSTVQEVMLYHSFETKAFRINYNGQWIQAIGKADITLNALVDAPANTMNFFGQGNDTRLDKTGDYKKYYRTRFDFYQLDPALRWHTGTGSTISAGPSFQYYHFDNSDNNGRSIEQPGLIKSYDSTNYTQDKLHVGIIVNFISNRRNNQMLPSKGFYLAIKGQVYSGLNSNSKGFTQIEPEFTYYQKIDTGARLVLSDRIGGGVSFGNPAYYQSLFLGGQGNLLGYLQNRFAGNQLAFNDFQARYKLANIAGYILPGELGLSGFYDVGRVWISGEHSDTWHQGTGGGIYFCPANLTVIQLLAGHSNEGWYPYISLNFKL